MLNCLFHKQDLFDRCFVDCKYVVSGLFSLFPKQNRNKKSKVWLSLMLAGKFEWLHNNEGSLGVRRLAQCSSITMSDPIPNPSNIIGISVILGAIS